jgi:protein SCO1/2
MGSPLMSVARYMLAHAASGALIASQLAATAVADEAVEQRVNLSQAGWPLGEFTLTDHHGSRLTRAQMQGHWSFLVFGDTHCATPCTGALTALAAMLQRIAPTAAGKTVQVVFVSLDPAHDTRALLRDYVLPFDNRFIGATGSPNALRLLLDDTGVADSVPGNPHNHQDDNGSAGYLGSLVLIDPNGVVRAEYLPPFDVKRLTAEFLIERLHR